MNKYIKPEQIEYQLANLNQLVFEVTDRCNLKCKYCGYGEFYEDFDKREDKNLPIEKAIGLLEYLNRYWQSNKNLSEDSNVYISFYGGEPLLNMNFIEEVVNYIEKMHCRNRHFSFSMTTNAILLDRYIDFLVEKKFNLLISLDGNKDNNQYRVDKLGKTSFERITKNIAILRKKNSKYFRDNVNFNSVLHDKNSIESVYRFFKETYQKIPSIAPLNDMGIKSSRKEEFKQIYKHFQESLLEASNHEEIEKKLYIKSPIYQGVCTFLHQYGGFTYFNYRELLYGKREKSHWLTGTCFPFGKKIFITVNGKILPCERIGQQFALGEMDDNNNIILDFEKIANIYNNHFSRLEKQCGICYNKKACIQCIFNLENLHDAPICEGFMGKKEFENYINSNLSFLAKNPDEYYRIMEEITIE